MSDTESEDDGDRGLTENEKINAASWIDRKLPDPKTMRELLRPKQGGVPDDDEEATKIFCKAFHVREIIVQDDFCGLRTEWNLKSWSEEDREELRRSAWSAMLFEMNRVRENVGSIDKFEQAFRETFHRSQCTEAAPHGFKAKTDIAGLGRDTFVLMNYLAWKRLEENKVPSQDCTFRKILVEAYEYEQGLGEIAGGPVTQENVVELTQSRAQLVGLFQQMVHPDDVYCHSANLDVYRFMGGDYNRERIASTERGHTDEWASEPLLPSHETMKEYLSEVGLFNEKESGERRRRVGPVLHLFRLHVSPAMFQEWSQGKPKAAAAAATQAQESAEDEAVALESDGGDEMQVDNEDATETEDSSDEGESSVKVPPPKTAKAVETPKSPSSAPEIAKKPDASKPSPRIQLKLTTKKKTSTPRALPLAAKKKVTAQTTPDRELETATSADSSVSIAPRSAGSRKPEPAAAVVKASARKPRASLSTSKANANAKLPMSRHATLFRTNAAAWKSMSRGSVKPDTAFMEGLLVSIGRLDRNMSEQTIRKAFFETFHPKQIVPTPEHWELTSKGKSILPLYKPVESDRSLNQHMWKNSATIPSTHCMRGLLVSADIVKKATGMVKADVLKLFYSYFHPSYAEFVPASWEVLPMEDEGMGGSAIVPRAEPAFAQELLNARIPNAMAGAERSTGAAASAEYATSTRPWHDLTAFGTTRELQNAINYARSTQGDRWPLLGGHGVESTLGTQRSESYEDRNYAPSQFAVATHAAGGFRNPYGAGATAAFHHPLQASDQSSMNQRIMNATLPQATGVLRGFSEQQLETPTSPVPGKELALPSASKKEQDRVSNRDSWKAVAASSKPSTESMRRLLVGIGRMKATEEKSTRTTRKMFFGCFHRSELNWNGQEWTLRLKDGLPDGCNNAGVAIASSAVERENNRSAWTKLDLSSRPSTKWMMRLLVLVGKAKPGEEKTSGATRKMFLSTFNPKDLELQDDGWVLKDQSTGGSRTSNASVDDEDDSLENSDEKAMSERPERTGLYPGCIVCGLEDNDDKIVECSKCNIEYHIDCVFPNLPKVPSSAWLCEKCTPDDFDDGLDQLVSALPPSVTSRFGEICFAQGGSGYGWWPCILYDPRCTVEPVRSQARKHLGNRHLVYFFQCPQSPFSILPLKQITAWTEGISEDFHLGRVAKTHGKQRFEAFQDAMQIAWLELDKPHEERLEWDRESPAVPAQETSMAPPPIAQPSPAKRAISSAQQADRQKRQRTEEQPNATAPTAAAAATASEVHRGGPSTFTAAPPNYAEEIAARQRYLDSYETHQRYMAAQYEYWRRPEQQELALRQRAAAQNTPYAATGIPAAAAVTATHHSAVPGAVAHPPSVEMVFKIVKKAQTSGEEGTNIGFVESAAMRNSTFAQVREKIEEDLDEPFPADVKWKFFVPGPDLIVSNKQEKGLGPLIPIVQRASKYHLGTGTYADPFVLYITKA